MTSNIETLASMISSNVSTISSHLRDNGKPFPSFAQDGPVSLGLEASHMEQTRAATVDALKELLDLLQGPVACIFPDSNTTSLLLIAKHNIAGKVPLDGTITYENLAAQCNLNAGNLRQVIRYAISHHHIFTESKDGHVAHSLASRLLATDSDLRAGVCQTFGEFLPAYSKTVEALEQYHDQEPNHTGFALAHGTNGTMFDHLSTHPDKAEQFGKAMRCYSRGVSGFSVSHLVDGYDWASLGPGSTVVDVGGSDGYASLAISQSHPSLRFIVQDLPDVIARAQLNTTDENNIEFQAHDFFTPQPATASAYLIRWVFHDWPDHYVVRALENLVPALRPGAKIIVNESLCPEPGSLPLSLEQTTTYMDMLMLSVNNSRLRSVVEWQGLFDRADPRFGTVKCSIPNGAALAILEVEWMG